MKYVSNIKSGTVDSIKCLVWNETEELNITVSDTDSGVVENATCQDLVGIDCFGFGQDYVNGEYLVVQHSYKTVMLHNHILYVSNSTGTVSLWDFRYDRCFLRRDWDVDKSGVVGNKWIAISVDPYMLSICGKSGNIAVLQSRSMPGLFVYTLYDMLIFLCKKCELNLLAYEVIKVYSTSGNCTVTIKLEQSQEAHRFFTKMYLDVMS